MPRQHVVLAGGGRELRVEYRSLRDGSFEVGGDGDSVRARIHAWAPHEIDVEIDGRRARSRVTRHGERIVVHGPRGDLDLAVVPRFVIPGRSNVHGGFAARMPGKVIDVRVAVGDAVKAGQTLLVLEAMKMEHPMTAPHDGVVTEVRVTVGDQVQSGAVLLVVEPAAQGDA
jgi:propionyl-CoA carboxylase alpha chain